MDVRFHRKVQVDVDETIKKYNDVSSQLGDDFFGEFQIALNKVKKNPRLFHFDHSGLRRCDLERFPYHFLYDIRKEYVRIWVLRHDHRRPTFGAQRF